MKLIETGFKDLYIIEPQIFGDNRGYFLESFNQSKFEALGLNYHFVQDNESLSKYGTLRGLHFQHGQYAQAKLVRVLSGRVLDVVVDLRKNSGTYGKHFSLELTDNNKLMMMIPRGFAHGFVVLSENALFNYKCDNFYNPSQEGGLAYNDLSLGIDWRLDPKDLTLSEKDLRNPLLAHL